MAKDYRLPRHLKVKFDNSLHITCFKMLEYFSSSKCSKPNSDIILFFKTSCLFFFCPSPLYCASDLVKSASNLWNSDTVQAGKTFLFALKLLI